MVHWAVFTSLAVCVGIVAFLMYTNTPYWGWLLFGVVLLFGDMSIKTSSITECPNCGHTFQVKVQDD